MNNDALHVCGVDREKRPISAILSAYLISIGVRSDHIHAMQTEAVKCTK